jgi:hypothetical protein
VLEILEKPNGAIGTETPTSTYTVKVTLFQICFKTDQKLKNPPPGFKYGSRGENIMQKNLTCISTNIVVYGINLQ